MYFVPLAVIVVLYLMILNRLWYGVVPGGSRSAESVRGKKRVTRMVVIVVVTFIVCWFPIQVCGRGGGECRDEKGMDGRDDIYG